MAEDTLVDRWIAKAKNHPVLAVVCFLGVVVIGFATVTDALSKLIAFFRGDSPGERLVVPKPGPPPPKAVDLKPPVRVYVHTLTAVTCDARGGFSCIVRTEIRTPPPTAGIGSAVFEIPPGARNFEATLSHFDTENCKGPNGNWTGEVLIDGKSMEQRNMHNVGSHRVSLSIPAGARKLELRGIDNNNTEWCDDTTWRGAVFTD